MVTSVGLCIFEYFEKYFFSLYEFSLYITSACKCLEKYNLINPDVYWVKICKVWILSRFKGHSLKFTCFDRKKVCAF